MKGLGDRGIEKINVSNTRLPTLSSFIDQPAQRLIVHDGIIGFFSKIDEDLHFGTINENNEITSVSGSYPVDRPILLKSINGLAYAITSTGVENFMNVYDIEKVKLLGRYNIQDDYEQPPTTMVTEIFMYNNILHIMASPPYLGQNMIRVRLSDYTLIDSSLFGLFSLVEKNGAQVGRVDGVMRIHHDMNFDFDDTITVPMPEHVKLIYFDRSFDNLIDDPAAIIDTIIGSSAYLKRFQISQDEKYSYFASDQYGFTVIQNQ